MTYAGQQWSADRRVLAWRPRFGHVIEVIHPIDQTARPMYPHSGRGLPSGEPAEPAFLAPFIWLYDTGVKIADAIVEGIIYALSWIGALICTPIILALRVIGVIRSRIDVRLDGTMVDKQYVRGWQAAQHRVAQVAELFRQNRFRSLHVPSTSRTAVAVKRVLAG
ncbi:hypothetical protein QSJ18_00275 [Gordonia sp. ABSL1-1]|uniref:hypothetical protein n=1 Tax=Gordonia sp. ABSL1-1 TaxID=3053923 RepID=UPI0025733361|nr:hypothetical protein [Gordonia sp. ABSL1-1]MDL9935172.1 hypothetical protein [Gordonia sp. ABSL1-1]